jgi:hypothetical protein
MSRIFKFENLYSGKNSLVKLFANKVHLENNNDFLCYIIVYLLDVLGFINVISLLLDFDIFLRTLFLNF